MYWSLPRTSPRSAGRYTGADLSGERPLSPRLVPGFIGFFASYRRVVLGALLGSAGLVSACASNDKTDHPSVSGGNLADSIAAVEPDAAVPHLPGEGTLETPDYDINDRQVQPRPQDRPIDELIRAARQGASNPDAGAGDAGAP